MTWPFRMAKNETMTDHDNDCLCIECNGEGVIDCDLCEGTGNDPDCEQDECPQCDGNGLMDCPGCYDD